MKNTNTKIKFSDIAGMLERDEMREIIGGSGVPTGSGVPGGSFIEFGGGGLSFTPLVSNSPLSSVGSFQSAGFVGYNSPSPSAGSINIQIPYSSSSSAGSGSSSSGTGSYGGYGGFSSWGAFGTSGSTYGGSAGSSSYGSGSNVYTGGGGVANVNNNNGIVSNIYGGGIIGNLNFNVMSFGTFFPSGNTVIGASTASSTNYLLQGIPPTDCFFQCLGWISQMNGDTVHDANYYASVYAFTHPNSSVIPNFNLSTFNIPSTNGIPLDQASAFAGVFFKATDYSGASNQFLSNWINPSTNPSGDRQLIGVYETKSGGLHAVAVTSISGSTVNFYDPQNGLQGSYDMSVNKAFYGITANK